MEQFATEVLAYLRAHPEMAVIVIGVSAFAESFAVVSFFVPGFTILVAAGALVQTGLVDPVPAALAGIAGATLGDAISFWIGQRFGHVLPKMWPFHYHPESLERSVKFFHNWGWPSVFIGRFFGPLRAFVPLAAGMCRMPVVPFYVANVVSAAIWAPALLFSGYLIGTVAQNGWSLEEKGMAAGAAIAVVAALFWLSRKFFKTD